MVLAIAAIEITILSGNLNLWMVASVFFVITGMDLLQHGRFWLKRDLV